MALLAFVTFGASAWAIGQALREASRAGFALIAFGTITQAEPDIQRAVLRGYQQRAAWAAFGGWLAAGAAGLLAGVLL